MQIDTRVFAEWDTFSVCSPCEGINIVNHRYGLLMPFQTQLNFALLVDLMPQKCVEKHGVLPEG